MVCGVLPDRLDIVFEEVEIRIILMRTGSLAMLIDGPEFLYGIDHGNGDETLVEVLFAGLVLVPEF